MAVETKQFTLEGKNGPVQVALTELPATRAWELYKRIMKAGALGGAKTQGPQSISAISSIIAGLLDEETTIRKELLSMVRVNGMEVDTQPKFDAVFTGNMDILPQVLWLALKENVDGFFGGKLGQMLELAKTVLNRTIEKRVGSSGPSTGPSSTAPGTEPFTTGKPASP